MGSKHFGTHADRGDAKKVGTEREQKDREEAEEAAKRNAERSGDIKGGEGTEGDAVRKG